MGVSEGEMVGTTVGKRVGFLVGEEDVGAVVGASVGVTEGVTEGLCVGVKLGWTVGAVVGSKIKVSLYSLFELESENRYSLTPTPTMDVGSVNAMALPFTSVSAIVVMIEVRGFT